MRAERVHQGDSYGGESLFQSLPAPTLEERYSGLIHHCKEGLLKLTGIRKSQGLDLIRALELFWTLFRQSPNYPVPSVQGRVRAGATLDPLPSSSVNSPVRSPRSKTAPPRIHLLACGVALILLQLAAVPAGQTAGIASDIQPGSEVVPHAQVGNVVTFSLSSTPLAVTLQGRSENSGGWKNLVISRNPKRSLAQLRIPRRWSEAELRVVANFASGTARRVRIKSRTNLDTRTVSFVARPNARLYSVEYKQPGGVSTWERVSTVATSSRPKSVSVHLPDSVPAGAEVRVMAVSGPRQRSVPLATPLSEQLREGPTVFAPSVKAASAAPLYASEGLRGSVAATSSDNKSGAAPTQEESDIWKMRGEKIYFFNRLRGLQIIDASVPADPEMLGSLPMAGAGEEMYLLGNDPARADAALLVTGMPWRPDSPDATMLSLVGLAGEQPEVETWMEIPGYYVDSRLVGGMLHVVTASWTSASGNWSPRTFLTTVDLSHSGDIQAQTSVEFACAPHAVGATGKYFWFAGPNPGSGSWSEHTLFAFPYQTDGSLAEPLQTVLGGAVQDKFKVGDTADGLAVVVQSWSAWQAVTSVETYAEQAGNLVARGQLELVRNEWLFATRFDRDRLYAVTFEQTDPLWIVDLSDSANPAIKGHLEVPGWSSYIQPVGDTLIAVGRDGGKVQVSLFDVADEANPVLAKRVDVGSGWSWSEAEWNEKAVKILPEEGLIMVPVVEWSAGVRQNRVSLLDFDAVGRTLSIRGTIKHDFSPRRAALMDESIIASVSNRELLLVDASDRGNPLVASETTLAFGVDRLLVHGGIALMFENGGHEWSGSPREAVLRTASAFDAENVVSPDIFLPCTRVEAAEIFGDRMFVVESSRQDLLWALSKSAAASPAAYNCHLSVWSLQNAANPVLLGRTELPFAAGTDTKILPANEDHVVVVSRERGSNFFIRPLPVVMADSAAVSADLPLSRPWFGWGNQQLKLAVTDISGNQPAVVGTWELKGDQIAGISDIFSAGDLLAFSYEHRHTIKASSRLFPWSEDWSAWRTSSWLQIVDLANPASPMPWAPVELPGELLGMSWLQRAGGVLFTRSGEDRVAALGFDGESAALAAETPAGPVFAMQGASLYCPADDGVAEWIFSEDARAWQQRPGWVFYPRGSIQELHVADGALLAGNWRNLWVLREDGSVSANEVPPGAGIGSAAATAESFLVPAGEYGAIRLD